MHVIIFNGSPRVQKFSNTDKILTHFCKGLESGGSSWERYSLSDRSEWGAARKAWIDADRILIALPLYVECIPGLLMEFLETLPPKTTPGSEMSFLLQGGFAEGQQLRCGEAFLKTLPQQLGCTYGGCLCKGDNFSIRFFEGKQLLQILKPYENMGQAFADAGNFETKEAREFTGPEQLSPVFRIILAIVFRTVGRRMFRKLAASLDCKKPLDFKAYQ